MPRHWDFDSPITPVGVLPFSYLPILSELRFWRPGILLIAFFDASLCALLIVLVGLQFFKLLREVLRILFLLQIDVQLSPPSDDCRGELCQLNASLSIELNEVASDVWAALASPNFNAVVTTLLDEVEPYDGFARIGREGRDFDAVLVLVLDCVVDDLRSVVADFEASFVLVEGVSNNL